MDGGQWLTVQEFAKAAGVSDKAIYSRLNGDLKPYLKTDKKRKYVNSAALDSIKFQPVESKKTQEDSNRINLIQEVERLKAERDQLRQDLHALEISAAETAARLDEVRKHEQEQAQTITTLNESLRMALFHAGTLRGQLEQAASVNQSDDLAKRDVISTDDIAKRDAVTVIQADGANDNGKKPEQRPDRQKAHKVHGDSSSTKKKPGFLSRLWLHK